MLSEFRYFSKNFQSKLATFPNMYLLSLFSFQILCLAHSLLCFHCKAETWVSFGRLKQLKLQLNNFRDYETNSIQFLIKFNIGIWEGCLQRPRRRERPPPGRRGEPKILFRNNSGREGPVGIEWSIWARMWKAVEDKNLMFSSSNWLNWGYLPPCTTSRATRTDSIREMRRCQQGFHKALTNCRFKESSETFEAQAKRSPPGVHWGVY